MSSNAKSQSQQKQLAYFFTLSGAIAWRLDWLTAIICNGNYIWQCSESGPLDLTAPGVVNGDGYVDLTGGVLDPSLLLEGGYLHLYPGRATAVQNPDLPWNSAFRDRARIDAKWIFFGQNSGTAPNLQVIGGAKPVVPTTIVAAEDNLVDDRQVNPIAALAEFLLDERGGSMLEAQLDAPSWLATAHYWAQDQTHRDFAFISPLITEQVPIRELVRRWLEPLGTFLRWTPDGKLGCFVYEWGTDPGGLLTLDARHFTRPPRVKDITWEEIPTALNVSFTDRGYEFQQNNVEVPNQRAADIRQLDDPQPLERPDVMRQAQAYRHGQEWFRRISGRATLYVRAPVVADLAPGDKIKFDDDPEPGGAGLAQLARIDKITTTRGDEATLEITIDPLLAAQAYTPTWISPLPEELFAGAAESAPSLAHFLALPLPPAAFDWPPAVGFVATRSAGNLSGFHAYFASDPADPFAELGAQVGFAARAQLVNAVAAGAGTLRLQLLDGAAGPDAYLAAATPGGNVAEAEDNTLLAILVALDVDGRVALEDGLPVMEFASILERSAVSADTHDYTVYRGRCSLDARAWGAGAIVWIIPRGNLQPWRHELFETMLGEAAYFRLGSFTSAAIDESTPLPQTSLTFPPAYILQRPTGYTVGLSSYAHTVACASDGTPLADELGATGTARTDVSVLRNTTALTAVDSDPGIGEFSIELGVHENATATKEDADTVRADSLTAETGVVILLIHLEGVLTITKKFTLTKARRGVTGSDGDPGDSVEIEYSDDGVSWHSGFTPGDLYMRQRIGTGAWSSAIRIVGLDGAAGTRGSKSFYAATSGSAWDNTEADAAIAAAGLTKVLLDTVTLYNNTAGFSETRFWNGSGWIVVAQVIDGNLIVHGTIGTDHLIVGIGLSSPVIHGGLLKLSGECTICTDTAEGADNVLVRINGGGGDGADRGGQVDVIGNEYTGVAGYAGSVLLTPGNAADGTVRLRARDGLDKLVVRTDGNVEVSTNLIAASYDNSTRRLKKDIRAMRDPLATIAQLRGVTFRWRRGGKADFGVIAEEIAPVLPAAVIFDARGRPAAVNYAKLSAVLLEGIKALAERVQQLERDG